MDPSTHAVLPKFADSFVRFALHSLNKAVGQAIANTHQIFDQGTHGWQVSCRFGCQKNTRHAHQGNSRTLRDLPAFCVVDQEKPHSPTKAQGNGFGFARVHETGKASDLRSFLQRNHAQPPRFKRLPNRRRSGPTGSDGDFSMNGGWDQAQTKQLSE